MLGNPIRRRGTCRKARGAAPNHAPGRSRSKLSRHEEAYSPAHRLRPAPIGRPRPTARASRTLPRAPAPTGAAAILLARRLFS